MQAFKRVKEINGKLYVYEIQPYYDKKTKKIRQKSKYVGKYNGDLEKAKKVRENPPAQCLSYGEFIPLFRVLEELELDKILREILDEKQTQTLVGLAMNKIVNPLPLSCIESWVEGTILSKEYPEMIKSSQGLSKFLKEIGQEEIIQKVCNKIIQKQNTKSTFIYDVTSITSYSKLISLFEDGYNRDMNGLPQVNYAVVIDKKREIPVLFDIYSGSIVDVNSLESTIARLRSAGTEEVTLILDRGMFSASNIEKLCETSIQFIIPGPLSNANIKNTIVNLSDEIEKPSYLKIYNAEPLFAKDVKIVIGEREIKGYLYFKPSKAEKEKKNFYLKLSTLLQNISEKLAKKKYKTESEINKLIEDIADDYSKFYLWDKKTNHIIFNEIQIEEYLKTMGKFILLYTGNYDWQKCLEEYSSRNIVERAFAMLKSDMEVMPLNIKTEETLRGLLFVYFISMLLKMKLQSKINASELNKKYSFNLILVELAKFKKIVLENGQLISHPLTKKQKLILKCFNYVPK